MLRWKFTADLPVNKCVNYSFKSTIKPGSGGTVSNEPFSTSNDRKFQCAFGEVIDNSDMDGDGNIGEAICRAANSADFVIPVIKSMQAKKYVKGAKNLTYLGSDKNILGIGVHRLRRLTRILFLNRTIYAEFQTKFRFNPC